MLNCMFINYPICDSQDRRSPFLYMRERKPRPGFRAGAGKSTKAIQYSVKTYPL